MENNKTLKQLLIAILVAICSAIVAFFSSSCAASRYDSDSYGTTRIYTVDTTYIQHNGTLSIKIK